MDRRKRAHVMSKSQVTEFHVRRIDEIKCFVSFGTQQEDYSMEQHFLVVEFEIEIATWESTIDISDERLCERIFDPLQVKVTYMIEVFVDVKMEIVSKKAMKRNEMRLENYWAVNRDGGISRLHDANVVQQVMKVQLNSIDRTCLLST